MAPVSAERLEVSILVPASEDNEVMELEKYTHTHAHTHAGTLMLVSGERNR